jgi:Zn-finger protein
MSKNQLQEWEDNHFQKVRNELQSLGIEIIPENIPQIIKAMSFKERSQRHPEQCPYYNPPLSRPCHPIADLNCLLCSCPNYDSSTDKGECKISKKSKGRWHTPYPYSESGKVWDCTDCPINHTPQEVRKYLEKNLDKMTSSAP